MKTKAFAAALAVFMASVACAGDLSAIGPARVWDFTSGALPAGVRLRKNGCLSERGLYSRDSEREESQGGAELVERFTPDGAFLFEAEFEVGNYANTAKVARVSRIWDDMGISYGGEKCDNTGLEIGLSQTPDGYWTPYAVLGTGSRRFRVEGVKRRLYDGARTKYTLFFGANGRVVMEFGGLTAEKHIPFSGGLAASRRYRPVIGSRPLCRYANFDGFVRRVSITPMRRDPVAFLTPGRMAFLRGETNAVLEMSASNRSGGVLSNVCADVEQFCESERVKATSYRAASIADGNTLPMHVPIETRLRPGRHVIRVVFRAAGADGAKVSLRQGISYAIGPQVGDRMRVAIWGMPLEASVDEIHDFGFTHSYVYIGSPLGIKPDFDPKPFLDTLDRHLEGGIRTMNGFGPGFYPDGEEKEKYMRWGRNGKPASRMKGQFSPEVSNPAVVGQVRAVSAFTAGFFAGHPSFQGILPYTEQRELSFPSFNTEHLRYRAETGREVPESVKGPWSVKFASALKDNRERFPDGVVPDDDENYLYWRWWLKGGGRLASPAFGRRGGVPQANRRRGLPEFLGSCCALGARVGRRRQRRHAKPVVLRRARADERRRPLRGGTCDDGRQTRTEGLDHDAAHLLPVVDRAEGRRVGEPAGMGEALAEVAVPSRSAGRAAGGYMVDDRQTCGCDHVLWLGHDPRLAPQRGLVFH